MPDCIKFSHIALSFQKGRVENSSYILHPDCMPKIIFELKRDPDPPLTMSRLELFSAVAVFYQTQITKLKWSQDFIFQPGPSGRRKTNHTQFIAWPSHHPQACLCILEELGASPFFLGAWRQARLFMGLILKGNQAQWTETKLWSEARKAIFYLLLQTGYNLAVIFFLKQCSVEYGLKMWAVFKCTFLKLEASSRRVQSLPLSIHIQQGDRRVRQSTGHAWSSIKND